MDFGDNIKLVDGEIKELIKFRKLINEHQLGKYVNNYIKQHNYTGYWVNNILYYTNQNKLLIYYKKYYILTVDYELDTDFEKNITNIFEKTKLLIETTNIVVPINSIFDILDLNIENINTDCLHNVKNALIDFSLNNNEIKFFIKNNDFTSCTRTEIYNFINNTIYDEYKKIEATKTKIAFCSHDYNLFNNEDYIYDYVKYLFQKGYWVDFFAHSRYMNIQHKIYLAKQINIFLYYDIFIYEGTTIGCFVELMKENCEHKIECIKNKMIIQYSSNFSWDSSPVFKKFLINLTGKYPKIIYNGRRGIDCIESYISGCSYHMKSIHGMKRLIIPNNIHKIGVNFDSSILKPCIENDSVLDKKEFFKINNLNINKQLVTIFLEWPKIFFYADYPERKGLVHMEIQLYYEKFNNELSKIINIFENNGCNVIFKLHPFSCGYINENTLYLYNVKKNKNLKRIMTKNHKDYWQYIIGDGNNGVDIFYNDIKWGIKTIFDKYKILDNTFNIEILKYSDYGIIFSTTTVGWFNYIYNFPIMSISTKDISESKWQDWFTFLTLNETNKDFQDNWNKYVKANNIILNKDKIIALKDLYYGQQLYWEDIIKDPENLIKTFLNMDHNKNFKYFENNPFFGNTYHSNSKDIGDQIIDLIENNNNLLDTSKQLNMFIIDDVMTIYGKKYININIVADNNICKKLIEIDIIKEPIENNSKITYGVSFEVGYYKNPCNLLLEFNSKIEKLEDEDIHIKIYTGLKWITLDTKLSNEYSNYSINEQFNLKSRSKWRISTTSTTVGQKIFIKDLQFTPNEL
jgi:hypothetical protein